MEAVRVKSLFLANQRKVILVLVYVKVVRSNHLMCIDLLLKLLYQIWIISHV